MLSTPKKEAKILCVFEAKLLINIFIVFVIRNCFKDYPEKVSLKINKKGIFVSPLTESTRVISCSVPWDVEKKKSRPINFNLNQKERKKIVPEDANIRKTILSTKIEKRDKVVMKINFYSSQSFGAFESGPCVCLPFMFPPTNQIVKASFGKFQFLRSM